MRQAERNQVFNNCQARIKKANLDYLQTHGYYITKVEDMIGLDESILGSIWPSCQEYTKHVKVVSDGIRVTDNRLEKMLKCIYTIEDIISKEKDNEHNVQPLIKELNDNSKYKAIPSVLNGIAIPVFFVGFIAMSPLILLISVGIFVVAYRMYYKEIKEIKEKREKIKEEIRHKAVMIISEL